MGRNQPCPCGSGKKFKRCCLNHGNINDFRQPTLVEARQWYEFRFPHLRNRPFSLATISQAKLAELRIGTHHELELSFSRLLGLKSIQIEVKRFVAGFELKLRLFDGPDGAIFFNFEKFQGQLLIGLNENSGQRSEDSILILWLLMGGVPARHIRPELYLSLQAAATQLREVTGFSEWCVFSRDDGTRPIEIEWVYWALPEVCFSRAINGPLLPQTQGLPAKFFSKHLDQTSSYQILEDLGLNPAVFPNFIRKTESGFRYWDYLPKITVNLRGLGQVDLTRLLRVSGIADLDPTLFPRSDLIDERIKASPWLDSNHANDNFHSVTQSRMEFQSVISWALRLISQKIPVWVGSSDRKEAIELKDIEILQSAGSFTLDKDSVLDFKWEGRRSEAPIWHPEKSGVLIWDPCKATENALARVSHQTDVFLPVQDQLTTLRFLQVARAEWRRSGLSASDFPQLKDASVVPQIWIEETGEFKLGFWIPEIQQRLWNFPSTLGPIWGALSAGLSALSPYSAGGLPIQQRGERRQLELKLLRHGGAALVSLQDTLDSLIKQPHLSEKQFSQEVATKTLERIELLLDLAPSTLESSLSKRMKPWMTRGIRDAVQGYLASPLEILSQGQIWRLSTLGTECGKIVLNRIFSQLSAMDPARLKKAAFKWVPPEIECVTVLEGPQSFGATPPADAITYSIASSGLRDWLVDPLLQQSGFNFFWSGKKIESLTESDWATSLAVRSQAGHKTDSAQAGTSHLDWFELHPEVFLRGRPVAPENIFKNIQNGLIEHEGTVYAIPRSALPGLERLEKFWDRLVAKSRRTNESQKESHSSKKFHKLPRSEVLEVLAMKRSGCEVKGDERWDQIVSAFESLDNRRSRLLNIKGFHGNLKTYQEHGVQWLLDLSSLGLGGILADDMGLGKTVQVLAFICAYRVRCDQAAGTAPRFLVIVPSSLVFNWKSEAAKFAPDLRVLAFDIRDQASHAKVLSGDYDLLIVTYGLMVEHPQFFEGQVWSVIFYDEAHYIKTITTQRTTIARKLNAGIKYVLTGTPVENHYGELYSLVDLVVPGALGEYRQFLKEYGPKANPSSEMIAGLKRRLRPLIMRRQKSEVLTELPEKIESRILLGFETKQQRLYRDTAVSWNEKVKGSIEELGESKSQIAMLTALLRLRQVCSDPAGIPGVKYPAIPPKIEAVMERLDELCANGESSLVFGQFIATLERAYAELIQRRVRVFMIVGETPLKKREKILREFQEGEGAAVLLMTLKTGGVGLNLVRANNVFHLDPWWNPAAESQATDRAHRLGQKSVVRVLQYVMKDSIEEKIEKLQAVKKQRFDALFSDSECGRSETDFTSGGPRSSALSQADFEYLIQ